MRQRKYFDHAASSPLVEECLEAFAAYDSAEWRGANPNSLHSSGRKAFEALEKARSGIARAVGAKRPSEIVLTSGGTESNNLAIAGVAKAVLEKTSGRKNRVLVCACEHDSVIDPALALRRIGFVVETVPVNDLCELDLDSLKHSLGDDVALVCVMGANNEVGTVQPVAEVVGLAHGVGALVHCDAIQTFGHIPFNVAQLGVDTASFAAHKIGGPVGIGALFVKTRTPIVACTVGGGQEGGLRSGTQDVRSAMGFAAAAAVAAKEVGPRGAYLRNLSNVILEGLCHDGGPCVQTVGRTGRLPHETLPNIVHLLVPGHQTEGLVLSLDDMGFEASGGSACSSGSLDPSHVLNAMGVARDLAFCALRLSFDHRTTVEDCQDLVDAVKAVCLNAPGRR